jgi:ribose 5-phosphate isomerase B
MKVFMGSDHAGYELKEKLKIYLSFLQYEIEDVGAFELENDDDYPDFITPVAQAVSNNEDSMGIIIGGSGQGEAMCANRILGARAAIYYGGNLDIVKVTRQHNNANILSLGARFLHETEAKTAVKSFLETPFSGEERHIRRIQKF